MDNEAEVFYGYGDGEGERKRVEAGVSEESIIMGSDKLKDLEGEEVFQEAMEPQEHFHVQGAKHYQEDAVVAEGDDAATVSASSLPLVDEPPSAAQDPDNFEEAIGVADESGKHTEEEVEVIANREVDKVGQVPLDSVHLDGVDSGGTGDGVSCDESYNMRDDGLKRSDWSGGKEE